MKNERKIDIFQILEFTQQTAHLPTTIPALPASQPTHTTIPALPASPASTPTPTIPALPASQPTHPHHPGPTSQLT